MMNVNDLVPVDSSNLYRYEKVNPDGTSLNPPEYFYAKYAPGELAKVPTPINRYLLMAIQGFVSSTTVFDAEGTSTQTFANGDVLKTILNPDGSIKYIFTGVDGTEMIMTSKYNGSGNIVDEVIE